MRGHLAYPTQVLVAEQGAYALLIPGRWRRWVAASAFGDTRAAWWVPSSGPSPTWSGGTRCIRTAAGEGQSVRERELACTGARIALAIRAFHTANCGHLGFSTASLISGPSAEDIQRHNEVISHFKAENAA